MNKGAVIAAILVTLVVGVGALVTLRARVERERVEKERVEKEKEALQREKADAEQRAAAEKAAREAAEAEQQKAEEEARRLESERARQFYIAQVTRQLDVTGGSNAMMGFKKTHDYVIDALHNGGAHSFTLSLSSGWQYNLISACDRDCSDIDIYVYDLYGNQIASDADRDDLPVVTLNVYRSGQFRIKVVMYKCNSFPNPCVYGIGVFGKY